MKKEREKEEEVEKKREVMKEEIEEEREKIEATGHRVDPDLRKAYEFVNQEIQNLQMMTFESQYQEFSRKLSDLLEASNAV